MQSADVFLLKGTALFSPVMIFSESIGEFTSGPRSGHSAEAQGEAQHV